MYSLSLSLSLSLSCSLIKHKVKRGRLTCIQSWVYFTWHSRQWLSSQNGLIHLSSSLECTRCDIRQWLSLTHLSSCLECTPYHDIPDSDRDWLTFHPVLSVLRVTIQTVTQTKWTMSLHKFLSLKSCYTLQSVNVLPNSTSGCYVLYRKWKTIKTVYINIECTNYRNLYLISFSFNIFSNSTSDTLHR